MIASMLCYSQVILMLGQGHLRMWWTSICTPPQASKNKLLYLILITNPYDTVKKDDLIITSEKYKIARNKCFI